MSIDPRMMNVPSPIADRRRRPLTRIPGSQRGHRRWIWNKNNGSPRCS